MAAAYAFTLAGESFEAEASAALLTSAEILLRTKPRFPVVAMLTVAYAVHDRLIAALGSLHVSPLHIFPWQGRHGRECGRAWSKRRAWEVLSGTYQKLQAFGLTQYRAVLHLDFDVAVLSNVDSLLYRMLRAPHVTELRTPAGCMSLSPLPTRVCRGLLPRHGVTCDYNTGVWAVRPSRAVARSLQAWLAVGGYGCEAGE